MDGVSGCSIREWGWPNPRHPTGLPLDGRDVWRSGPAKGVAGPISSLRLRLGDPYAIGVGVATGVTRICERPGLLVEPGPEAGYQR